MNLLSTLESLLPPSLAELLRLHPDAALIGGGVLILLTAAAILLASRRRRPAPPPEQPEEPAEQPIPPRPAAPDPRTAPSPEARPTPPSETKPAPLPTPEPKPTLRPAPSAAPKTLSEGLHKTRKGFIAKLFDAVRGRKEIEGDLMEEIEEILYTADIGAKTAGDLLNAVRSEADRNQLKDPEAITDLLKREASRMLAMETKPLDFSGKKPFVLMVIGVNGAGKTTTIGKLASLLRSQGLSVVLAAADTFRAAAVEQLAVWAERAGCQIISGQEGADPGSVVYNAIQAAQARGADVVIADTAGRLHTKFNLMEELKKVVRVTQKLIPDAPHETWLVLDANTGQNAINQARQFGEAVPLTGLILTKLDGTAKGGVIIGVMDELKLPVRYIGIGESIEDLRPFDPDAFIEALFERE